MKLSNRVRELRREQTSLTQADLALKVGVTRQTIIALEKGTYNPSLMLALQIASVLGVQVEDLFTIEADEIGI